MRDSSQPGKRRRYDAALRAAALRLASARRSTQATARALHSDPKQYPVRLLCQLVNVPASGYYVWQRAQQQAVIQPEPAWETALVKVFRVHKRCYGTRRLQVALRKKGHRLGRQCLRTAMRRRGLRAQQPKAFTPRTTDSTHGLRCAPNRLLDSLGLPRPTNSGSVISAACSWLTATGLTYALFRRWIVSR